MKIVSPKPGGSHRLRRLSEDEIDLWLTVAASVAPRPGSALPARRVRPPAPVREPAAPEPASAPAPSRPARVLPPLAPLERKLKQRLSRGHSSADAALDLHGLRQDEALAALRRFLAGAQAEGCRVVLVVTGKGGRMARDDDTPGRSTGVLRRLVPFWLAAPDFRTLVVGFEEAARSHGGTGALYVRLRRRHG